MVLILNLQFVETTYLLYSHRSASSAVTSGLGSSAFLLTEYILLYKEKGGFIVKYLQEQTMHVLYSTCISLSIQDYIHFYTRK